MLIYLDNDPNQKGSPNENFARELLELFTLGREPVHPGRRRRRGPGVDRPQRRLRRQPARRTASTRPGTTTGSRRSWATTQNWDGPQIITRVLTVEPQRSIAARFIAKKLWTFFAYPNPSATIARRARRRRSSARTSTSATAAAGDLPAPGVLFDQPRAGPRAQPGRVGRRVPQGARLHRRADQPAVVDGPDGPAALLPAERRGLEEQRVLGEQHRALGPRRLRPQPHLAGRTTPGSSPRSCERDPIEPARRCRTPTRSTSRTRSSASTPRRPRRRRTSAACS